MFKVLTNRIPSYVNDFLQFRVYKRDLRNSSTRLLLERKYQLSRYGKRSVSVDAANLWNALPVPLRAHINYSYFKSNVFLLIHTN